MLHVIQSNKMEVLKQQLVAQLGGQSSADSAAHLLLQADTVIVQSPGMAQWLKIDIAESLGVAANIDFPLPSSYIWQQYQRYFSDLPATSAFTKAHMTWKLMTILPTYLGSEHFDELSQYLEDASDFKLFLLCQKIADVYDQYQVYRPDWILAWEAGSNQIDEQPLRQHRWQPILWRALVAHTQQLQESTYHRANLHQQLLQKISQDTASEPPKPLFIFGLSMLPKQQLEVFEALALQREVLIFWCNPCEQYWGDIVDQKTQSRLLLQQPSDDETDLGDYFEVGNPLLASWGKPGRDYLDMLLSSQAQIHDGFIQPDPDNMLSWVQTEIAQLSMRNTGERLDAEELLSNGQRWPKLTIEQHDRSITVHACHSKVRELEILHDHLLHQFNADPGLSPSQVIVMMPDVAEYAPYIDGVFGSVNEGLSIPYAISDQNAAQESHLIDSYLQLMNLQQSRLNLSQLLSVLEVPALQARFDISAQDYDDIRFWLCDAGFHWGWDGADKQRWQLPGDATNTFSFAVQRMLAGYAMHDQQLWQPADANASPIAPYGEIEGQRAQALGKLMAFAHCIDELLAFCAQSQPLQQKIDTALAFIEQLYLVEESQQVYLNQLRQALESMAAHSTQFAADISQDIFVEELTQRLNETGVGQRFLTGAVNFCTLMPMRSIPFKHVCLLGMNDADYPRQTLPIGFDLMRHSDSRRGDRSRRLDDRYLFLEAILSARSSLYISYLGFSTRDNSVRNPSILLTELLDYLGAVFCLHGQLPLPEAQSRQNLLAHLLTEHRLQPFSAQYFSTGLAPSFQQHWLPVLHAQQTPLQPQPFFQGWQAPDSSHPMRIEVEDLVSFLINPCQFYFSQRWRTNLAVYAQELEDTEPFAVDALRRYHLTASLVTKSIQHPDEQPQLLQACLAEWQAQGKLPRGAAAHSATERLFNDSAALREQLLDLIGSQPARTLEIDLSVSGCVLQGWLNKFYGQDYVLYRPGKLRAQDRLRLWVHWLCACSVQTQDGRRALFVCTDKQFSLAPLSAEQARHQLGDLIDLYRQGCGSAPPFFAESGLIWAQSQHRGKTLTRFYGNDFVAGESNEPHIARIYPDLDAVFEPFCEVAERVFAPLLAHGEEA